MATQKKNNKLIKSCPFCGGDCKAWASNIVTEATIVCSECDAYNAYFAGKTEMSAAKKAIKAWNKRPKETEKDGIKSCPCCGSHNILAQEFNCDPKCYKIGMFCVDCGVGTHECKAGTKKIAKKKAIDYWNTRRIEVWE